MKEEELAEQFSRDLDEAFSGGEHPAGPGPDAGALETAQKLARADFSGDSHIREGLRAELLARAGENSGPGWFVLLFRRSVWLQAAAAAACLVLVMLPVMRQDPKPVETGAESPLPSVAPSARAGLALALRVSSAAAPGAQKQAPALVAAAQAPASAPSPARLPAAERGVFRSIPMASLAGGSAREFPIESRNAGALFGRVKGRKISLPKGSGVVWETEHAVFTLERREISPEELFRRKAL